MVSNYHRLIDGFLAELDIHTLTRATNEVNCGYDSPIVDIGF